MEKHSQKEEVIVRAADALPHSAKTMMADLNDAPRKTLLADVLPL